MRYLTIFISLLVCNYHGYTQNLVANGSFEDENICTEFSKNCAPEAWICNSLTANYYFDISTWAFEGRHFVGLIAGSDKKSSIRSFIRSRLLCRLRAGQQYRLSFYMRSRHDMIDSVGVYFSPTDFLFETRSYRQMNPSVVATTHATTQEKNQPEWKRCSIDYTASGIENFITIGNFKKTEYRFTFPAEINGSYYYYIDSIRLVPLNLKEMLCIGTDSMSVKVYEENERHYLLEKKMAYYRKNLPESKMPLLTVLQKIDTLIIPDILFATASATLNEKSFQVLDSFSTALRGKNIDSLLIEGHTDSVGTLAYNTKLSADRANAVSDYILRNLDAVGNKSIVHHFAYLRPVASNQTSTGRQRNRRVEIYLYTHE